MKLYSFALFLMSLCVPIPLHAQSTEDLEHLIRESKTRAALVQNVQKAVVNIKVEKVLRGADGQPLNNPSELYNDEFLKRFFPNLRLPQRGRGREFRQEGMGSGSIISAEGHILTNHHVVGEADRILVKLYDGRELEAKLVGTDSESDISVIQIEGSDLPVLPMGNSDEIEVGESVIAVGNPFGLSQTVTYGIVSAKGRSGVGITEYEDFIQTDAAINPGNSGGPLISLRGEIVGVNTAIFTRSGGYQGIGFAVPINMARGILEDLINRGSVSRGWLGVGIQDITPDLARMFNLESTRGSLVTGVMPGTPAEREGLQKGDIVVELNDRKVVDSNHFRNMIANARANAVVRIVILRSNESLRFEIRLDERPKNLSRRFTPSTPQAPPLEQDNPLGIVVVELTAESARQFGLQVESGVVIREVAEGSPAAEAGLRAGLVLQEMDSKPMANLEDFRTALADADLEKGVLLYVTSGSGGQYIVLRNH